jgi:hypothetical protein
MRRRQFITLLSGAVSWPLAARARQPAMRVIGILSAETPASPYVEALRVGLQQLGYVDGRNVRYEYRWAEGNFERLPDLAVELVGLNVDVAFVTAASLAALEISLQICEGVTNGTILDPKCDMVFIPDVVLGAGEAMRRREFIAFVGSAQHNLLSWRRPAASHGRCSENSYMH